jgi:hypothetical protein
MRWQRLPPGEQKRPEKNVFRIEKAWRLSKQEIHFG